MILEPFGWCDQIGVDQKIDEDRWYVFLFITSSGLPDLRSSRSSAADWSSDVTWPEETTTKMADEGKNLPIRYVNQVITKKLLCFISTWFDKKTLKICKINYAKRQLAMRSRSRSKLTEDPEHQEDHAGLQIFEGFSSKLLELLGLHAEIKGLIPDILFMRNH